jgi:hypothetical protein
MKCRSQGNPKVSLKHRKRLTTHKLRVKSCNGSTNRCVVKILLTERKVSVPLILVPDYLLPETAKNMKVSRWFMTGKTVTYVNDKVRANQASNQVLSSQTHSKSCTARTVHKLTPALGTALTVQSSSSGALVPKGTALTVDSSSSGAPVPKGTALTVESSSSGAPVSKGTALTVQSSSSGAPVPKGTALTVQSSSSGVPVPYLRESTNSSQAVPVHLYLRAQH